MTEENGELDPRIQIELENLNSATNEINKIEIELEEANSTFHILLNESTRRLKLSSKKLGNCIEKARPYYDALEKAREAQVECQKAAVKFQSANGIHAAAKETVALAEQRFMSNSHEWQFDNAWQEMLNHATQQVMDAEIKKADCHTEHQKRAQVFNEAELKVQQLEEKFRRSIQKSRPYFEEKQICQDQLQTQKNRIQELQAQLQHSKKTYATALRKLENISEEIHKKRGDLCMAAPPGPREPGVGAELSLDFNYELEKCEHPSIGGSEISLNIESDYDNADDRIVFADSRIPFKNQTLNKDFVDDEDDFEKLREKVRNVAVRPVEGGDGQQEQDVWENELNATVNRLDNLMMLKEFSEASKLKNILYTNNDKITLATTSTDASLKDQNNLNPHMQRTEANVDMVSLPATPLKLPVMKTLKKIDPLPSVNVSMRELPILANLSHEVLDQKTCYKRQRRRSLE